MGCSAVSSRNGIRVWLQGGSELFRFGSLALPKLDDEIVYFPATGDAVTYKVEKVEFNVKELPAVINAGPSPDDLDPYVSFVRIEVSEVV